MDPVKTTPELFEAVDRVLKLAPGRTWAEVKEDGGPSSATMKNLKRRTMETISEQTLRKLGDVYGWLEGTEFDLVDPGSGVRREALQKVFVGPPRNHPTHGRRTHRGKVSAVQLSAIEKFITTMQEALDELRTAVENDDDA